MAMDLGSVYSSLEFRLDKFEAGITQALNGFYKLQLGTSEASKLMDRNVFTAVNNIDKSYKLLELSSQRTGLAMFNNAKYTETLKEKMSLFDSEIKKTDGVLKDLVDKFGKNSKEVENYKSHILDLKLAHAELNQELSKSTSFSGRLESLNSSLEATESKFAGFTQMGQRFSNLGQSITTGVTLPIVGVGIAASKVGMDFEAQMSRVKAISQSTGAEFEQLEQQALDLGASTAFSAKEVALSQENLASAGFKVNEILSATSGVLDLAASSGADLGTASSIAAGALRGFGLEASQSAHVADVLAKAAADTNANVNTMGDAFKYVAPVARGVGLSLEEVSAAIGIMANASIDGSTAGTTLRGAITRLADPTKESAEKMQELGFNAFDSNDKMKNLSTIIGELGQSMNGLTDKQKQQALSIIFGQEAMSGMLTLIQGGKGQIDDLATSFKNSDGAAKEMATTMQENAKSSVEQMVGSLETAGVKIEKILAPSIKGAADSVGRLADKFSQLDPEVQNSIIKFGLLAASVGPVLSIFGRLMGSVSSIASGVSILSGLLGTASVATVGVGAAATTAAPAVAGVGTVIAGATTTLLPWIAGIAAAGFGLSKLVKYLKSDCIPAVDIFADRFITDNRKVDESFKKLDSGVKLSLDDMNNKVKASASNSGKELVKISDSTKKAVSAYMDLDKNAGTALLSLKANNAKLTGQLSEDMRKNITESSKKAAQDLKKSIDDMSNQIITGLQKRQGEAKQTFQEFFKNAKDITDNEKANILKSMENGYEQQKKAADAAHKQINEIYLTAANNNRQITNDELNQIQQLQEQMKKQAIDTLTQSQLEQQAIYEGIKANATRLTDEQASDVIKNSAKQRDESVKIANDQYLKTVAEIAYQRDVTGTISADQAQKLINEAERQRKESVGKAEEMHKQVVDEVGKQCEDVGKKIDEKSGEIKTPWQRICDWFTENVLKPSVDTSGLKAATNDLTEYRRQLLGLPTTEPRNGGLTWNGGARALGGATSPGANLVGEEGTEIVISKDKRSYSIVGSDGAEFINMQGGEQVIPHEETAKILARSKNVFSGSAYASGTDNYSEGGETVLNNRDTTALMDRLSSKISYASSRKWGTDMTQGLADGINSNKSAVRDAAFSVANSIHRLLHFSVPDEGPLSDADTYGSDFMQLLADTMEQNSDKPAESAKKVADLVSEKVKSIKDNLEKDTRELNNKLSNLAKEEEVALRGVKGGQRYAIQDEYDVKRKVIKDEIQLRKDQADKEIEEIQRIGKVSKEELKKELTDRKDFISKVNNLNKQLIDALKEKYKEEEQAQEDALNAEIENLDKWKEESEQRINDVYDLKIKAIEDSTNAQIKALQAESDALDEQQKQQDRALQDQEELANIKKLQDKIAYEHNDFNKAELQKQLDQAVTDRQKRLNQQAIEDKKDSLQKQIEQIEENADKQKQILENERKYELDRMNQLYKAQKNNLQKQLNDIKAFYAEKTKEARLQAEAEKLIMDNNQKEIVALLHTYEKDYELVGQSLGERLVNGFKPKVDEIRNMISNLAQQLSSLRTEASNALSSARSISSASSINWYATGAIFNKPSVIGVGEAGPEAVVPIEKLGGILREALSDMKGSGGATINNYSATINSPIAKSPSEERRAYEATMRKLAFGMRY